MLTRTALASLALVLAQSSALAQAKAPAREHLSCMFDVSTVTKIVREANGEPSVIVDSKARPKDIEIDADGVTDYRTQSGNYDFQVRIFNGNLRGLVTNVKTKQSSYAVVSTRVAAGELTQARLSVTLNPSGLDDLAGLPKLPKVGSVEAGLMCQIKSAQAE